MRKIIHTKTSAKLTGSPTTMEELLNSLSKTSLNLIVGSQIEGEVVSLTPKEAILYLGTKSEGVLPARHIENLKVGDKIKAYVVSSENENGQVVLSSEKLVPLKPHFNRGGRFVDLSKFNQALKQKSILQGSVLEVNKGGLILEVDSIRGFLPGSQIGIDGLGKLVGKDNDISGQNLSVTVIEIDSENNRLIFSQKGQTPLQIQDKLKALKNGVKVSGKVLSIYPFGVLVDLNGDYGMVFPADITWEKMEDPTSLLKVGQDVEGVISGVELDYGRINLFLKQVSDDPFSKLAEKFQTDDVVSVIVSQVSPGGVYFSLDGGVEGFMLSSKMEAGAKYEVGSKVQLLVDSIDSNKRRINLAPFITSTKDLIYK